MDPIVLAALIAAPGPIVVALIQLRDRRAVQDVRQKVTEAHHTLTTNSHASATPTIPDRLDDLGTAISEVKSWQERHDERHRLEQHRFYGYQGD